MADLSLYRNIGKFKFYKPDEIVFLQNEIGDEMYVVAKGRFGVYINSFTDFPTKVAGITEDGFFGEMSAIDGWMRSATVISEEQGVSCCSK
jgi:CRP-like cAMP-binding protein